MKDYTAIIERCPKTGFFIGSIPGIPGAHTQGESLDELRDNLKEVLELVLEDNDFTPESEFVGTQLVSL